MKVFLQNIAQLLSGLFAKPDIDADTLYLQGSHFNEFGEFDSNVKPYLNAYQKNPKHLLSEGDILFAAKGLNNFAVVYNRGIGKAVASSSFIILRVNHEYYEQVMPEYLAWYLSNDPHVRLFHKQLGTTIPSISIEKLSRMEIEIPSLETQREIIHIQFLRNREKQILRDLESHKDQLIKHQLLNAAKQ